MVLAVRERGITWNVDPYVLRRKFVALPIMAKLLKLKRVVDEHHALSRTALTVDQQIARRSQKPRKIVIFNIPIDERVLWEIQCGIEFEGVHCAHGHTLLIMSSMS